MADPGWNNPIWHQIYGDLPAPGMPRPGTDATPRPVAAEAAPSYITSLQNAARFGVPLEQIHLNDLDQ